MWDEPFAIIVKNCAMSDRISAFVRVRASGISRILNDKEKHYYALTKIPDMIEDTHDETDKTKVDSLHLKQTFTYRKKKRKKETDLYQLCED